MFRFLFVKLVLTVLSLYYFQSQLVGGDLGRVLPMIIFGGLTVLAGGLSFLLPETGGQSLPENVQDVVDRSVSHSQRNKQETLFNIFYGYFNRKSHMSLNSLQYQIKIFFFKKLSVQSSITS